MAFACVVIFDGVNKDRIEEFKWEIGEGECLEGFLVIEIIVFYDVDVEKLFAIFFFDIEDDYRCGDEVFNVMFIGDILG